MRHPPIRYRNGYYRTLTYRRRRNRWLLAAGVAALLLLLGTQFATKLKEGSPVSAPADLRWA